MIDHPDVYHLLYADFAAAPVDAIAKIYRHFGIALSTDARAAMTRWLDDNSGDRHGKFTYSLDDFGISPDALEARFSGYRSRFAIPYEGARP